MIGGGTSGSDPALSRSLLYSCCDICLARPTCLLSCSPAGVMSRCCVVGRGGESHRVLLAPLHGWNTLSECVAGSTEQRCSPGSGSNHLSLHHRARLVLPFAVIIVAYCSKATLLNESESEECAALEGGGRGICSLHTSLHHWG